MRAARPTTGTAGEDRKGGWGFRVALLLACLIYAFAAVGSGLDRLTAYKSDPATEVPEPFAGRALQARVWYAMAQENWNGAVSTATALVARDPVEPNATALLGAAREGQGDAAGADAAFRVAAQMGGRVELTQRYWAKRAEADGDLTAASAHVDALLRQRPGLLSDRELLDPVERNDKGQQALAARLASGSDWLSAYLSDVWDAPKDVLTLRAQVLGRASQFGVVGGCDAAAKFARRMVELNEAHIAAQVWREHCPRAGTGLVSDGNFTAATFSDNAAFASVVSQFDWQMLNNSDVDTSFTPAPGAGRWLTVNTSAPYTRVVASQLVVAPAGTYRLSWASQGHTTADTPMIMASLDCGVASGTWLPATLDSTSASGTQRWHADAILDDSCVGKALTVAVRPGVEAGAGVRGGVVSLGAVRLEPLTRP